MAHSTPDKNVCPCCGRREGVLLEHQEIFSTGSEKNLPGGGQNHTSARRLNGYHALCNRQCLCCEFAWRIADGTGIQPRPTSY